VGRRSIHLANILDWIQRFERRKTMNTDETAERILEQLDKVIQIDWNRKEIYLKAIKKGLKEDGRQSNH
jgi:hypothetical protein